MVFDDERFKKEFRKWLLFKHKTSIIIILLTVLLLLNPLYVIPLQNYYSKRFLLPQVQTLSAELWEESATPEEYTKKVLQWQKQNMKNIYGRRGPLSTMLMIIKLSPFSFCMRMANEPSWVYLSKCGACGEYAYFFTEVVRYSDVPVRTILNPGDDHTWTEVLLNGKWVVVDPSRIKFNVSRKEFSNRGYMIAEYPNGTKEEVTQFYRPTSKLKVVSQIDEIITLQITRKGTPTGAECELERSGSCNFILGNTTFEIEAENSKGILKYTLEHPFKLVTNKTSKLEIVHLKPDLLHTFKSVNFTVFRLLMAVCLWGIAGFIIIYSRLEKI